ncbi:hypothetical protein Gotri_011393 [Gossypium trilobum]|uniref:Uncharacterized protein n=1 Tax=Gossypium trilobum TaxID=34281 RepID=A0A7J9EU45_9ROSI|nr:hypothetical protein [Gossypium trilobum]
MLVTLLIETLIRSWSF